MSTPARFRISVDAERCQGHNRCHAIAPELFEVDDFGAAKAIGNGEVPPPLEDKARRAMSNCPEHAVRLTKAGAGDPT
ncbi:MAG: ferredoxin [Proteobacteria bacterium]|nr:ferredoxin [Pseudomonadota bacterium]